MAGLLKKTFAGKKNGRRMKNLYADALEEDTGGGTDIFRPPVLIHSQIAADIPFTVD
jgi:hypothetical protein